MHAIRATVAGTLALLVAAGLVVWLRPRARPAEPVVATASPVPTASFHDLGRRAQDAFDAGQLDDAERYASWLLAEAPAWKHDWDYGNALHKGHLVLGLVAEARGDRDRAVRELGLAGATPGSPQLDSFGPNMALARVLLADGETEAVLAYFERCRTFWNDAHLDLWADDVRAGRMPEFGANLLY